LTKKLILPIGECGFHTWNATHNRAEVFYNMRNENFKQKGLMKEALKKSIRLWFYNDLHLHRIQALIDA
jgi:ribosomal-protein-alanine N-acetyltransferase